MRGTPQSVNRAMIRPILLLGVEKRLAIANFALFGMFVECSRLHLSAVVISILLFGMTHFLLTRVSKSDPHMANIFVRYKRYAKPSFFPAKSYATTHKTRPIETVTRF